MDVGTGGEDERGEELQSRKLGNDWYLSYTALHYHLHSAMKPRSHKAVNTLAAL